MFYKLFSGLALVLALLLLGCGKASKLHGSWDAMLTNGLPAVATFNPDGTHMFVADNPMAKTMKIKMMGKYREEGDLIYITWTGVEFENTPAEAKALEPQMMEGIKKQLEIGKEMQTTAAWESDAAFKTTSPTGSVTTFKKK